MQEVINVIISNGIFATLFVGLLFFQLKDSSQREKKYIAVIEKFAKQLDAVEDVKENIAMHFNAVENVRLDVSRQTESIETVRKDISEIKNVIYFNNTTIAKKKKEEKLENQNENKTKNSESCKAKIINKTN